MKHRNGLRYEETSARLHSFAKRTGDIPLEAVQVRDVLAYIETPRTSAVTWHFKYNLLRNFFIYCEGRYTMGRIPLPPRKPPAPPTSFTPHIYSRAEIRRLLRATSQTQKASGCAIDARTLRTFLLFLYGTGALISEARQVLLQDIDLRGRKITFRGGVFDRTRTIPIGCDLHSILTRYVAFRIGPKNVKAGELFISKSGRPLKRRTLDITFRRVRECAGLNSADLPNPPRMHDLRNAFVVHRLAAWYKTGADLRRMIPALSAYIGQVGLTATERYLRLTPERFRSQLEILSPTRSRSRWRENAGLMKFLVQL
jgi:integrase/recombinase XerD